MRCGDRADLPYICTKFLKQIIGALNVVFFAFNEKRFVCFQEGGRRNTSWGDQLQGLEPSFMIIAEEREGY